MGCESLPHNYISTGPSSVTIMMIPQTTSEFESCPTSIPYPPEHDLTTQYATMGRMIWHWNDSSLGNLPRGGLCTGAYLGLFGRSSFFDSHRSDAREWTDFRSLFHPGAFVYTTWTGRTPIEDFIKALQDEIDEGASIMHRIHGSSVDLAGTRAVVKTKATITQRFELPPNGCELF